MNKVTTIRVKPGAVTATPENIEVPEIETHIAPFVLKGLSPLLVNNFSEKSKQQMEDQSTGKVEKGKPGARGKAARVPEDEYQSRAHSQRKRRGLRSSTLGEGCNRDCCRNA